MIGGYAEVWSHHGALLEWAVFLLVTGIAAIVAAGGVIGGKRTGLQD